MIVMKIEQFKVIFKIVVGQSCVERSLPIPEDRGIQSSAKIYL